MQGNHHKVVDKGNAYFATSVNRSLLPDLMSTGMYAENDITLLRVARTWSINLDIPVLTIIESSKLIPPNELLFDVKYVT